jgi:hypothetical protein
MAIESLVAMARDQPNGELIKLLRPGSKFLGDQSMAFRKVFDQKLPIAYFYELQTTPTARFVSSLLHRDYLIFGLVCIYAN